MADAEGCSSMESLKGLAEKLAGMCAILIETGSIILYNYDKPKLLFQLGSAPKSLKNASFRAKWKRVSKGIVPALVSLQSKLAG